MSDRPLLQDWIFSVRSRPYLWLLGVFFSFGGVNGCWRPPEPQHDPNALKSVESRLALKDVTLEETDPNGKTLWKIRAKQVTYSPDRKVALVKTPRGELFQDGKLVYQFTAQTAQILQDQPYIKLMGQAVVTELKHNVLLKSAVVEWRPKQHLIEIPMPLTITHRQLQASAKQGKIWSREQRADLIGNIIAVTSDPQLKLTTDRLTWHFDRQQLTSDVLVKVEHSIKGQISDRGQGQHLRADQIQKTVLLEKQAQIELQEPPLNIASESLLWDLQNRKITSKVPLQIHHRKEKMTLNAQTGWVDLPSQVYYLKGNVQGHGERQQASFTSDQFTWMISTNQFLAEGNFVYQQNKPKLSSRSPKAQGEFKDQFVVLYGGNSRVETEITPNSQ